MAKLLVIDDDRDTMRILEAKLTDAGYQILQATDGKAGLEKAQETLPDLILLDVMMPELDGLSVLKHLKFDAQTEKIPVIIMTAKGEKMEGVFKMEGAAGYLTKPFVFASLLEELNKSLPKERGR
ncbi:response regulator [bacterium]|nr:response regulator [bacterium]